MPKKTMEEMIEELALMIGRGFQEITEQIYEVRRQGAEANDRLDRIEMKVTGLAGRVEVLEDMMRLVRTRLSV